MASIGPRENEQSNVKDGNAAIRMLGGSPATLKKEAMALTQTLLENEVERRG
jgi:hypothetical protein